MVPPAPYGARAAGAPAYLTRPRLVPTGGARRQPIAPATVAAGVAKAERPSPVTGDGVPQQQGQALAPRKATARPFLNVFPEVADGAKVPAPRVEPTTEAIRLKNTVRQETPLGP